MTGKGKSRGAFFAAGLAVALILSFTGRASADTKPRFVYVVNAGSAYGGDTFQSYQFTGTAACTSSPCLSTLSITGSFSLDLNTGQLTGTFYVADSSDLLHSPLAFDIGNPTGTPVTQYQFRSQTSDSKAIFYFPLSALPTSGSGGTLCTSASISGCPGTSTLTISKMDMTPSLLASTGGTPVVATISSGSFVPTGNPQGSGTVSEYSIDSTTGALSLIPGSPVAAGSDPYSLVVDPSNRFVYVANRDSNNVSAYTVNSTTGALTPMPGSPFATGFDPYFIAADPKGKFIYVANQRSNTITVFLIDAATGALTQVNGSPFSAPYSPMSIAVNPTGTYLYVANGDGGGRYDTYAITGYTIDPATGSLTQFPGPSFYGGPQPIEIVVDPSGKFLYEAFQMQPWWGVAPFSIQSTTGALTAINACNGPCGDTWPGALAVHPSGKYLYVTSADSNYVAAWTIDPVTGETGLVPGSPTGDYRSSPDPVIGQYGTGGYPDAIAIDPSGKFAYVANRYSNNVSAFSIDGSTGALAPIPGSPFPAGVAPASVGIVGSPASVAFSKFKVDANIDEDRKTSFHLDGFFTLGDGSDGIYPLSEPVALQVGSYSVALPAGLFHERGRHEFEYEGHVNDVDLRITIEHADRDDRDDKDRRNRKDRDGKNAPDSGNDYHFTAEGRGRILQGIKNPVAVGLAIADDEGSVTVKADIDR